MSAIDKNPGNFNMLSPLGFKFQIKKLPNVNFFLQTVNIPDISLPQAIQPTPFVNVPLPGDHLTYGDLNITFKVDEDFNNYIELHNWIRGLGFPENLAEYGNLARKSRTSGDGIYSDVSIIATTNLKNPNVEFAFQDAWPTYIGQFTFNTTPNDVNFISCQAIFKYTLFNIEVLPV